MAKSFVHLQVRFYDETLLDKLRLIAELEHRSMNAQILAFLEESVKRYENLPASNIQQQVNDNKDNG